MFMFLNKYMEPKDSSESTAKKRTRGITKMADLILARYHGRKIYVKFNKKNAPLGRFEKKMMSYLGCMARHYVPVDIHDWHDVTEEMKNKIWDDIFVSKF